MSKGSRLRTFGKKYAINHDLIDWRKTGQGVDDVSNPCRVSKKIIKRRVGQSRASEGHSGNK